MDKCLLCNMYHSNLGIENRCQQAEIATLKAQLAKKNELLVLWRKTFFWDGRDTYRVSWSWFDALKAAGELEVPSE